MPCLLVAADPPPPHYTMLSVRLCRGKVESWAWPADILGKNAICTENKHSLYLCVCILQVGVCVAFSCWSWLSEGHAIPMRKLHGELPVLTAAAVAAAAAAAALCVWHMLPPLQGID